MGTLDLDIHATDNTLSSRILRAGTLLAISLGTTLAFSSNTFAQGLGSVTPGGVQPQIERRSLPSADDSQKIEIPAVKDRPFDIDDGPTVFVSRFQLEGVVDIPEAGIKQVAINRILEEVRQQQGDGFTIGQLQETAGLITQYYRQRGLILAFCFIPQQKITDGVVVVSMLAGELGQLSTANNNNYTETLMKAPFEHMLSQPVQARDVESALLRLDDLPGLDAVGIFRPGKEIGETELVLSSQSETPFEFGLYADDHGVNSTGKQRVIASMVWNNPIGLGDRLALAVLQTFDPEDSTYGELSYETLLFNPALSVGLDYSLNDYAIGQAGSPNVDGETEIMRLFSRYSFERHRDFSLWGIVDFSRKWAQVSFSDFDFDFGEDNLSVVGAEVGFTSVDSYLGGGINQGNVRADFGLADFAGSMDSNGDSGSLTRGGSGEIAGGDFQKLSFQFARLQAISANHSLLLRTEGQHSDDLLTSLEQYSMGGPNSVRAYPVSEYIREKAVFVSAEWLIDLSSILDKADAPVPGWELVELSVFVDYAKGRANDPLEGQKKEQNISGVGIGLELNFTQAFFVKAEAATPLSNQDASNGDDPQFWLSAGLEF